MGITGAHYHAQLIFIFLFLVLTGFHHVSQTDLELLTSGELPTLASEARWSAETTGVSHYAHPFGDIFIDLLTVRKKILFVCFKWRHEHGEPRKHTWS